MKILMIAHYVNFPSEGGNNRFCYILDLLKKNKQNIIELITSDFRHATKEKHKLTKEDIEKLGYKVTFIHEPSYEKNISIKRLYSARALAKNTKKYLKSLEELPDVIYCAVPSLDIAKEAAKFAKKKHIKFIIDIQDLWPEAFKMAINIPIISNVLLLPMKTMANYIYSTADEIVAVSQTYVNRGLKVNKKARGISVYLGTDSNQFEKAANNKSRKKYKQITAAYVGTLGHSYDLITAIDALSIVKEKGVDITFLVMGDGPLKKQFQQHALQKNINCEFTGRLPYNEMCNRLTKCHFAINPIRKKAAQSIINKHADYAMSGLPVFSTQEPGEYSELIDKCKMGYNCKNEDPQDLAKKIILYLNNGSSKIENGARNCAAKYFDRKTTYIKIIRTITKK